jgi:NAD(P)-dependent dehydrogenase (short-subunit alcohol dehydrogenase family)
MDKVKFYNENCLVCGTQRCPGIYEAGECGTCTKNLNDAIEKYFNMNKKVILITGSSRGIGKAISEYFKKLNWIVIDTYNNTYVENSIHLDLSDVASIKNLFSFIEFQYGKLDVVVNNASIAQRKDFLELTSDDLDNMYKVNFRGTFMVTQEAVKLMLKQNYGNIINISSIAGQWGGVEQSHYAMTKASIINLTKSIVKLYSKNNIRCNCIAPGLIDTDMIDVNKVDLERILMGKIGKTDDICSAVEFLATDKSKYITGQTINVNGGMYFG